MLGAPEFQRRIIAALEAEALEQAKNLMLAKDWSDLVERRGRIRGLEWALMRVHEIIKAMEA